MFRKISKSTLLVLLITAAAIFANNRHTVAQEPDSEIEASSGPDQQGPDPSVDAQTYIPELVDALEGGPQDDPSFDNEGATAQFNQAVDLWRLKLQEANAAAIRFHNGDSSLASKYRGEFQTASNEARKAFDSAFEQAVVLMNKAPSKNLNAAQFAMLATYHRFNRNWYEKTGESAAALLKVLAENRALPEITGVSLYCIGQFEQAKPYLQEAVNLGLMEGDHYGLLQQVDEMIVAWDREQELRKAEAERDDLPRVLIKTTKGDIVVELFEDQVPNTVANFISLVEEGVYRGVPFYQVVSGQVALAGDTRLDPMSSPFFLTDEEVGDEGRHPFRGTLCMAKVPTQGESEMRTYPNSASSHFFIPFKPMPLSMKEHICFGRIIEGIENFSVLNRVDSSAEKKEDEGQPKPIPDLILSTEVIRKRNHDYKPDRILNPLVNGDQTNSQQTETKSQ